MALKPRDAEIAAYNLLKWNFECTAVWLVGKPQTIKRGGRWIRLGGEDVFGCDVIGKRGTLHTKTNIWVQVTISDNITQKKKKLEEVPWGHCDLALIVQLRESKDPANRRRKIFHFRVSELSGDRWWVREDAIAVPREWFKLSYDPSAKPKKKKKDGANDGTL